MVRIHFPPPASLSHQCLPCLPPERPGFCRECEPGRDQRTGRAGPEPARLGCFSLTGIAAVPPSGNQSAATRRAQALAWARSVAGRSSARQEAALIGPVERQIEFGKARRSEFDRLPALQDGLDQLGAEEGEVDEAPDIAPGDALALGQFPQRSGASGGKLLEPRAPAGDRLDQRGVASRTVVLNCHSRQHQPHLDTAAPEGRCKAGRAVEQFPGLVAGYACCTEALSSIAGLVSASAKTLITASSIS